MKKTLGIKHLALKVKHFRECLTFYTTIVGMEIDWQPDDSNAYLSNGKDNLALHEDKNLNLESSDNRLDHFGIMLTDKNHVDEWHDKVLALDIEIYKKPQDHRDGSRSFYCYDPDKNILQFLWHPSLNK
jgi:catechol-2,3-dioxygenase